MRLAWAVLLVPVVALAADWPQYLGPTRDGRSAETGVVAGWKAGPRELWRVPVGNGYASVAVVGDTVFAMGSEGDKPTEEQLLAIDVGTGRVRWRASLGAFWDDPMGFDGPRATPAVAGDRVIALSGSGLLGAFDRATGKKLWSVDLVSGLDGARPQWGFAGSPLVSDGKVYLSVGGKAGLVALSLADGKVAWKREGFSHAGYASPVRATLAGKDQVVFFTGDAVVGASPADGAVIWSYPWDTDYSVNAASPLVVGSNRLFVASAYGVGGASLLVDEHGKAAELWHSKKAKNKTATSVLHEGFLYGFNEDRLNCVDAKTGEERWSQEGYGRGTLLLAEGHLFVQTEDCRLTVVEATPSGYHRVGEVQKVLKEESECWSTPALAGGVLYVRDNRDLVALEVAAFGPR